MDLIDIPYSVIDETPFGTYDNTWISVEKKLIEYGIKPQPRNKPYVTKFRKYRKRVQLKDKIYNTIVKLNPIKTLSSSK